MHSKLRAAAGILVAAAAAVQAQPVAEAIRLRDAGRWAEAVTVLRAMADFSDLDSRPELLLAETLGWQKEFAEAEGVYRRLLAADPSSREARLGLGRVLLWQGRYDEARSAALRPMLAENPADADAREELARSWYWSGDFRAAAREFRAVLQRDPQRESAARSLSEIVAASRPGARFETSIREDDQPWRLTTGRAVLSLFSDPLTRWDVSAGSHRLESGRRSEAVPFASVTASAAFPSRRVTVDARAGAVDLPGNGRKLEGALKLARAVGRTQQVALQAERQPLLLNRAAIDGAARATRARLSWSREKEDGWLAAAGATWDRFSDGNHGTGVDGWFLAPVASSSFITLEAGVSAMLRDTDETRFRPEPPRVSPLGPSWYAYRWTGIYDPYWTPLDLEEARGILALSGEGGRIRRWRLQVSGGVARDEGIAFGPAEGTTPVPPETLTFRFPREYHPWTAAGEVLLRLGESFDLRLEMERSATIDYEADTLSATLVRRF